MRTTPTPTTPRRPRRRRAPAAVPLLGVLLGLLGLLGLSACGLSGTNNAGYIEGDGQVVTYAVDDRDAPIELSGTTLQGTPYDLADQRGKVVVVNVWGSWCGACIGEAPMLEAAHQQLGDQVAFLGIDVRDSSRANPLAFERGNGVTYPSLYSPDSQALRPFRGKVNPHTTPATLVLDQQGRVAAVIGGAVPSKLTLVEVVRDVQGKSATKAGGATGATS